MEKLRDIQVQLAREEQEKSEERNVQNKLSIQRYRLERAVKLCDEANEMLYRISREFDAIERRYNMLIEQKTVFASRVCENPVHFDGRRGRGRSDNCLCKSSDSE